MLGTLALMASRLTNFRWQVNPPHINYINQKEQRYVDCNQHIFVLFDR